LNRREFIDFGFKFVVAATLPVGVLASGWNKAAFEATIMDSALYTLYGNKNIIHNPNINIKVKDIVQNGGLVPVSVEAKDIKNVKSISILCPKNPHPLNAKFDISENVYPFVSTRLKLARTSDIYVVVESNGKLYANKKQVKISIGGMGA
jgi:sulfur-oxidizing protein SoxY